MDRLNITNARKNLYKIVKNVNEFHQPLYITGKEATAVLISEKDWKNIQETLYLNSIPGMADSIKSGMEESIDSLSDKLEWE